MDGAVLGLAAGSTIWLDQNAAGWGWFVDATPSSDSEFIRSGDQGEQQRIDLLTVVMHELGHVLGHEHDEGGVMAETLAAGIRRTEAEPVQADAVDQVFAAAAADRSPLAGLALWDAADGAGSRRRGRK